MRRISSLPYKSHHSTLSYSHVLCRECREFGSLHSVFLFRLVCNVLVDFLGTHCVCLLNVHSRWEM